MSSLILALVGALAALIGAFFAGKSKGKAKADIKIAEYKEAQIVKSEERKAKVEKVRRDVEEHNASVDSSAIHKRLQDKWTRD